MFSVLGSECYSALREQGFFEEDSSDFFAYRRVTFRFRQMLNLPSPTEEQG
jgi:hypothetical protein